jgi:hypothetical protein
VLTGNNANASVANCYRCNLDWVGGAGAKIFFHNRSMQHIYDKFGRTNISALSEIEILVS